MLKVGITGGIGSGKTTCCKLFETLGIPVYYSDTRAKWLMNHDKKIKKSIKSALGNEAYHKNGRINKKYIASQIFLNKEKLKTINSIVHPAVFKDAQTWFNLVEKVPYALQEAALLIESGSYKALDQLIVVSSPLELRIKRVVLRDNSSSSSVRERISNQLDEKERIEKADYVIYNDETQSLIVQVVKIHHDLINHKRLNYDSRK